jgi:hypothetical protein
MAMMVSGYDAGVGPEVGDRAPEFVLSGDNDTARLSDFAARHERTVLTTQDSYRYHRN